jgi:hypothetical protein
VRDADVFIRLHFSNAEQLDVTPHHIFTLADGSPMRADRLCPSDVLVGRFGRVTLQRIEVITEPSRKVTISCEPVHGFFAGRFAASFSPTSTPFRRDGRHTSRENAAGGRP